VAVIYDYHVVLSIVGIFFGLAGYALYFRSIFRGETKPHVLSWFTYAVIDAIVFLAQVVKGAGPGAWPLLLSVIANSVIVVLALRRGEKDLKISDWISFSAALFSILLWVLTSDPLIAVVFATFVNIFALYPTFRKSYSKPYEESITLWSLDVFRFGLSILALSSFNPTTVLFTASIVVLNSSLVTMVLLRRRQLAKLASNI